MIAGGTEDGVYCDGATRVTTDDPCYNELLRLAQATLAPERSKQGHPSMPTRGPCVAAP